ncbi:MAG: hypothetical protein WAV05_02400 [Anaerolineales bacterium]
MSHQPHDQSLENQSSRLTERTNDIWETSDAAKSLARMQANPRIKYIVIIVPEDACPACQNLTGTYPKDEVPRLPYEECSHPLGCRSYYLPFLDEIYP